MLELWTDGTISPLDALSEAADSLVEDFFLFKNLAGGGATLTSRPSLNLSPELYQTPIERLELSHRTLNCLKRAHITRVGEVLEMSDDELLKIRNFGEKSLSELRSRLAEQGVGGSLPETASVGLDVTQATVDDDSSEMEGISVIPSSQGMENLIGALSRTGDDDDDFDDDLDYDFEDEEEDC